MPECQHIRCLQEIELVRKMQRQGSSFLFSESAAISLSNMTEKQKSLSMKFVGESLKYRVTEVK